MLDWDDLRFFLAVARHRTLAGAARHLHVTQSTVSRRIAAMQEGMGVRLLQRTPDGYLLTLAGESIRQHVERVEAETRLVESAVVGMDARLAGLVRVSSSQVITSHLLAPCFAALHERHPDILIEALPDLQSKALTTREADVVVGLRRFEHHDLVARSIGHLAFGLYACVSYVARRGEPDLGNGCSGHRLITMIDDQVLPEHAAWLTEHAGRAQVVLRADSYETQHSSANCSGGLALLPRFRADEEPTLRRIAAPVPVPPAEIWLGAHHENRLVPRVRAVLDCIAEVVRGRSAILDPPFQASHSRT